MKQQIIPFLQLLFLFSYGISFSQNSTPLVRVAGFLHPESVVFDETNDFLFVSNIGEDTAGDGYISKVSIEGKILDTMWISGLNDPKGLLVQKGKLFATDNTRLIEVAIESAQITNEYSVKDAVFLNDIAADEEGNLFISDTGKNSIFKLDTFGNISEWMNTDELESPNGLYFSENKLLVAAWGNGEAKGNFLKIDPETKEIEKLSKEGLGNLDGLQQNRAGEFYLSDWSTGKIFKMNSQGDIRELLKSERSVGDILLMEDEGLLLLPMNLQNEVWWYTLKE